MKKKILLLYISDVSGHRSAAAALEKAIKILDPDAEVLGINTVDFVNPISGRIVHFLYMGAIKNFPWIWSYVYDNQKIISRIETITDKLHRRNAARLKVLLDRFSPHVVACTQAYPCGTMADFKAFYRSNIPLIGILTDYAPHSYWMYDLVDCFIAPSETVKQRFIAKGALPQHVKTLGIPFDPKFNQPIDKEAVIKNLGLKVDLPIALIMGGSHGLGPLKTIVSSLEKVPIKIQEIIVTGINSRLYRQLKKIEKNFKQKILVLGYADNVHELMSISDLIITKPGGITTAEALAKGLPMIIIKPIPGQEENNTAYLIQEGAAIRIDEPHLIHKNITELLFDREKLDRLRQCACNISKPNAAMDIAKLILDLCG